MNIFNDEYPAIINHYLQIVELISNKSSESIYVFDILNKHFLFVSDNDLFLSGKSIDKVIQMGYEYFSKLIDSNDIPLFYSIQQIILEYLLNKESDLQNIFYFAFNYKIINHGLTLMVYHKTIPIIIEGQPTIAICSLSSSVIKKSGNLEIHYKNEHFYDSYSFKNQRWEQKSIQNLTTREKEILILANQGKQTKEIANILDISPKTIRNLEIILYNKLGFNSIIEAIIYATNHNMIFQNSK